MAIARVLTENNEALSTTERTVTSPLAEHIRVFLPPIGDGTGGTVVEGYDLTISQTVEGGSLDVLSNKGNHVVFCKSGESKRISAWGNATNNRWVSSGVLPAIRTTHPLAINGTALPQRGDRLILVKAFDPIELPANGATTTNHTLVGVAVGDPVSVSFDQPQGATIFVVEIKAPDTIQMIQANLNGIAASNPGAGTLRFLVDKLVGVLPAGASLQPTSWLRRLKPDGAVGLIPMWDEVA